MLKKYFVKPNDPILVKVAKEIPLDQIDTDQTQRVIEKLLHIAYGKQKNRNKPLLVGLAAPQVGISKRIILVDTMADGKGAVGNLQVFVNPQIIWESKDQAEWYEGCWSTDRVCGIVERPVTVKVKAYKPDGNEITEEYNNYTARIFQHEIDHLNGKEFVSHITNDDNLHWVEVHEWIEYRNKEAWRNWPKKCPRTTWRKIKFGSV